MMEKFSVKEIVRFSIAYYLLGAKPELGNIMDEERKYIKIKKERNLVWIIIDRKEAANALGIKQMEELRKTIDSQCIRNDISVVAITGSGDKYFTSGIDLKEVASIEDMDLVWDYLYQELGGVINSILSCKLPVVAGINGYTMGAGLELIYATDMAFAVKHAKFGLTAVRYGMVPPISPVLGIIIANSKLVTYLSLTGDIIEAEDALKMGLLNEVSEDITSMKNQILRVADKLSKNDRLALIQTKALISETKRRFMPSSGLLSLASFASRRITKQRIEKLFKGKKTS
ncbi:MAG: enoyl-CoA hydratase/isomerase family protein [Caldisphaeraceae archaeon]|nr:enoyl-CoA hydratase/isomerase family protein [Caldisphaeraceae archaeon]